MECKKEEILQAYRFRHACQEFDNTKKIRDADFHFILETGRLSPSSYGFEPWKFVVLQNQRIREKLLPFSWGARKQLPTSSHLVIMLSRVKESMLYDSDYILNILQDVQKLPNEVITKKVEAYKNFLQSDFKLLDNERAMFEWACRQTYIALGNMMTVAAQIGIDSCPIEGFEKEPVEKILQEEGIIAGNEFGVSCMVAFGYRAREPREKTRRSFNEVVQWIN